MFVDTNLLAIFTTGLLTVGVSCLAVQGGLLASVLSETKAQQVDKKQSELFSNFVPVLSFVVAKLVAYTLLGAFLGWLGSVAQLSPLIYLILQFTVVIFILGTALNLLNVHPIFRYFVIQPPYFLTKLIRKQSHSSGIFAPALLGVFTVFIPCGVTQAMMALAITSGNPFVGASILFAFILGTSPLFFLLGYATMRLGDLLKTGFRKIAAFILLLLFLVTLNGALALTGTQFTISNILHRTFCIISYCTDDIYGLPVTEVTIHITNSGYTPDTFSVPVGREVTIHLINEGTIGCQQAFTIPALGLQKVVPPNQKATMTFLAPEKAGFLSFMCSAGFHPGSIKIVAE